MVELADKITPNLDVDMACYLENVLSKSGVKIIKSKSIQRIEQNQAILNDGAVINAEMVLMATGVRPNVEIAKAAGIKIGITGAIAVDTHMQTNLKDIYACGDCIETFSTVTGKPVYRPLGSTANKTGRKIGRASCRERV